MAITQTDGLNEALQALADESEHVETMDYVNYYRTDDFYIYGIPVTDDDRITCYKDVADLLDDDERITGDDIITAIYDRYAFTADAGDILKAIEGNLSPECVKLANELKDVYGLVTCWKYEGVIYWNVYRIAYDLANRFYELASTDEHFDMGDYYDIYDLIDENNKPVLDFVIDNFVNDITGHCSIIMETLSYLSDYVDEAKNLLDEIEAYRAMM